MSGQVSSPNGRLELSVGTPDGQLTYSVRRGGRALVLPSALGLQLTDGSTLGANVTVTRTSTRTADTRWRPVWGADATIRDHYRELTVGLRRPTGAHST